MLKFSIIIPTYNREKVINRALNSVIEQDFWDWEIIVIDDGSSDNTKKVLEKYLSKYKNIKYFYKKNGGVGSARNYGIGKAIGDYCIFLDSDDILTKRALSIINNQIEKFSQHKIFFFAVVDNFGRRMYKMSKDIVEIGIQDCIASKKVRGEFLACVKTSLFTEERYCFPDNVNGGESILWCNIMRKYRALYFDKVVRYYYLDASNSLVRGVLTEGSIKNILKISELLIDNFNKEYLKYNKKELGKLYFVIARMRALLKRDSFRYFKMGRMYNKADVRAMILYLLARIDINYKINNIIIKIINQRYFKR
jgi:glycosyltransferase involved in cell wall biosynthesis